MSSLSAFTGFQEDAGDFSDLQTVLFDSPCKWNRTREEDDSSDSGFGSPDTCASSKISRSLFPKKRSRDDDDDDDSADVFRPGPVKRFRLDSESDDVTIAAVERLQTSEGNLVGDGSRTHRLPHSQTSTHRDLKLVTASTVARLLQGGFDDSIASYSIVDCRYPYEFQGGHIVGAVNIYTEEGVSTLLRQSSSSSSSQPPVLLFHCEFSSERAPKLMRHLRNEDRRANSHSYPALHFPEIYLIDGGYKAFYNTNTVLCEPQTYVPMQDADHSADLRVFRARSKSCSTRSRRFDRSRRLLAARSVTSPSSFSPTPDVAVMCF